jgi:hypothetical protein
MREALHFGSLGACARVSLSCACPVHHRKTVDFRFAHTRSFSIFVSTYLGLAWSSP